MTDQALVAGKQARDFPHGPGRHAEQAAGHVQRAGQGAGPGHVHAVVVAWRKVDVGKATVGIRQCRFGVAKQLGCSEALPLGLEDPAVLDSAALAHASVGRHQQGRRVRIRRARADGERPGEKSIEAGIVRRLGVRGLGDVDLEMGDCQRDQPVLEPADTAVGHRSRQAREQAMRQQILGQHRGFHWPAPDSVRRSAAIAFQSSGGRINPACRPCGSSTIRVAE